MISEIPRKGSLQRAVIKWPQTSMAETQRHMHMLLKQPQQHYPQVCRPTGLPTERHFQQLLLLLIFLCFCVAPTTQQGDASEQAAWVKGQESKVKCGGGAPCVWVNKDINWVEYIPTFDPRNAGKPKPDPPAKGSWEGEDVNLVISISSFRDKLCPVTLFNLYTKAQHPARILVQVVQQNVHGHDLDCYDEYCELMHQRWKRRPDAAEGDVYSCPYSANIHVMRINADEAKGPQWARAIGSTMLQDTFASVAAAAAAGEETDSAWARITPGSSFCMQMDAHMDVVTHYDRLQIAMWADAKNEMVSVYFVCAMY